MEKGLIYDALFCSALPLELRQKGIRLSGEIVWPAEYAVQVVKLLSNIECVIVGVEWCQNADGSFKWIASSNYNYDNVDDKALHAQRCAEGALGFIHRFENEPGALFNFIL